MCGVVFLSFCFFFYFFPQFHPWRQMRDGAPVFVSPTMGRSITMLVGLTCNETTHVWDVPSTIPYQLRGFIETMGGCKFATLTSFVVVLGWTPDTAVGSAASRIYCIMSFGLTSPNCARKRATAPAYTLLITVRNWYLSKIGLS